MLTLKAKDVFEKWLEKQEVAPYKVMFWDIPKIVQLKANNKLTFKKITLEEAKKLYFEKEKYISDIKKSIKLIIL